MHSIVIINNALDRVDFKSKKKLAMAVLTFSPDDLVPNHLGELRSLDEARTPLERWKKKFSFKNKLKDKLKNNLFKHFENQI